MKSSCSEVSSSNLSWFLLASGLVDVMGEPKSSRSDQLLLKGFDRYRASFLKNVSNLQHEDGYWFRSLYMGANDQLDDCDDECTSEIHECWMYTVYGYLYVQLYTDRDGSFYTGLRCS